MELDSLDADFHVKTALYALPTQNLYSCELLSAGGGGGGHTLLALCRSSAGDLQLCDIQPPDSCVRTFADPMNNRPFSTMHVQKNLIVCDRFNTLLCTCVHSTQLVLIDCRLFKRFIHISDGLESASEPPCHTRKKF